MRYTLSATLTCDLKTLKANPYLRRGIGSTEIPLVFLSPLTRSRIQLSPANMPPMYAEVTYGSRT
jgi:hypothetical protein